LQKGPLTSSYILFYILFWPDTWRIIIGILAAWLLPPHIMPPDLGLFGSGMFYFMIACIGYAASASPARGLSRVLQRLILKKKPS